MRKTGRRQGDGERFLKETGQRWADPIVNGLTKGLEGAGLLPLSSG
jgi:hypothetical protein